MHKLTQGILFFLAGILVVNTAHGAEQPNDVVHIEVRHTNGTSELGSGVLIKADLVLSCYHLMRDIKGGSEVWVAFKDGTQKSAKIVKVSKKWDLSLLRIKPVLYQPAEFSETPAGKGHTVTICGFPGGDDYHECSGRVVGVRRPSIRDRDYLFVVNHKCKSGMSGGPVRDHRGKIVGILFGSLIHANCSGLKAIEEFLDGQISEQDRSRQDASPSGEAPRSRSRTKRF